MSSPALDPLPPNWFKRHPVWTVILFTAFTALCVALGADAARKADVLRAEHRAAALADPTPPPDLHAPITPPHVPPPIREDNTSGCAPAQR